MTALFRNLALAALGRCFDRAAPELLGLARRLVGSDRADDVLQETFLAAIERPGSYERGRPLMPWLVGVLVNRARVARFDRDRVPDEERLAAGVRLRQGRERDGGIGRDDERKLDLCQMGEGTERQAEPDGRVARRQGERPAPHRPALADPAAPAGLGRSDDRHGPDGFSSSPQRDE